MPAVKNVGAKWILEMFNAFRELVLPMMRVVIWSK